MFPCPKQEVPRQAVVVGGPPSLGREKTDDDPNSPVVYPSLPTTDGSDRYGLWSSTPPPALPQHRPSGPGYTSSEEGHPRRTDTTASVPRKGWATYRPEVGRRGTSSVPRVPGGKQGGGIPSRGKHHTGDHPYIPVTSPERGSVVTLCFTVNLSKVWMGPGEG